MDDHPVCRLATTAQLSALGYACDAADSGQTALALLTGEPYDAVLLDCEMPHLDGYETCRLLRQREVDGRRTPVIALTAHAAPGERERCLAAGMDDHLGKPVRSEELAAALERWLEEEAASSRRLEERLAALERLGKKTGEDVLGRVVESFLHRGAADIETMRRALARGEGAVLAAAAHSLAGSSGILGATELAEACAEIEELARRRDLAACEPRLDAVERTYQGVARKLSA